MDEWYKTNEVCCLDGIYECDLSGEVQKYQKGDIFDTCPLGKPTRWRRIAK